MSVQKSIIVQAPKHAELVTNHPIPALRGDYLLIRTVAVAVNPTDWKHVDFLAPAGVLIGCDFAGIVEAVGPRVKKPWRKGDRVCGMAHGCNEVQPEDGAFAEYIVAQGDVQMRMPDTLSFEAAATLGVGVSTLAQGMYQHLGLAWPTEPPMQRDESILIYGGSTATGTLAIQFAKLSGYTVYTTCSRRNFRLVKCLGADHVLDYNEANSASEIRRRTNNALRLVFDCISTKSSVRFCDEALSTNGGKYDALLRASVARDNVTNSYTGAYTIFGETFVYGPESFPAKLEDKAFAESFLPAAERLIAEGKIKPHPQSVGEGGLNGCLDGMQRMREGKVSGEKLVYRVDG